VRAPRCGWAEDDHGVIRLTAVSSVVHRWQPALWAGLAVGVAAGAGVLGGSAADPLAALVGTSITRAGMDVAGVTCAGLALLAVFLPRRETVPGSALRSLDRVQTITDRALVAVAGGWVALVLLGIAFRAADAFGQPVAELGGGQLLAWSTRLAAGRGMVLSAACAATVGVCAIIRLRDPARVQTRLPLVMALFGVLTPAVTGHAGTSADHQLAVVTVALHAGAAALWVGGLGAVLALLTRHRELLDRVLPRFSRLAGVCVVAVALTGTANALLRLGSVGALFGTQYGGLVLAKTGCLVLLAGLGGLARRRLQAGRLPVLRWAGIEVALMAITLGLAAALTQTAAS
jgi:copper resistance protein D